jgi:hypothetical protein
MSKQKLRIHNTDTDNLVSNLRGEVGEIIVTWILLRQTMVQANNLKSPTLSDGLSQPELVTPDILSNKLRDEIVARLSELAEQKIGRLTFHFAQVKLGAFEPAVRAFSRFIQANRFEEKRNYDISHKELPEKWSDHKFIHIPYGTLLKGIAMALRLIKKIDRFVLGPSAPCLWREMRKRRYTPMHPPKVGYLLLPHLRLSEQERAKIIIEEAAQGQEVWTDMPTTVDGRPVTVKACRKWGAILLGQQLVMLGEYPLQELASIVTQEAIPPPSEESTSPPQNT